MINTSSSNPYNQFMDINKYPTPSVPSCSVPNAPIASVELKEKAEDKGNALTKTVASLAITGAAVGFVFTRSGYNKFYKIINGYIQKLDDEIYKYSKTKLSWLGKAYDKFNKGLKKIFEWIGATNNLTAAKDVAFKSLCEKLCLKKPMDWITSQFKNIVITTSRNSYNKARNIADNNIAELRNIVNNITDVELKKELTLYLKELEKQISNITTATNRQKRLVKIEAATQDIGDNVKKELKEIVSNFRENREKLRIYRTEVHAAKGKEELINELREARHSFTFNIDDKAKILNEACDTIGQAIKIEDISSKDLLREARKLIKKYTRASGDNEEKIREKIIEELTPKVQKLASSLESFGNYSDKTQILFKNQISEIIDVVNNTAEDTGIIEKILKALKNNGFKKDNPKTYALARKLTKEIRSATNKAFDNEIKLYDKFAEYSVGAAPTDVVGLLFPILLGGYAVTTGENKDEKISATLKAGIPIAGAIATTFVAAAKMMTNMQGILIGGLTGLILNALGSKADEAYKQYQENNLFTQKAIAAYRQNFLDARAVNKS